MQVAIVFMIVLVVFWVYPAVCLRMIADKTDTPDGWLAWIPIGNIFLICKITKTAGWWTVLCLIPYVNIIPGFILLYRLPGALGVQDAFRFLIILPGINFFYLGYLAFRKETNPEQIPSASSVADLEENRK